MLLPLREDYGKEKFLKRKTRKKKKGVCRIKIHTKEENILKIARNILKRKH